MSDENKQDDAAAPVIPDLKKKEEEKKKAGAAWGGAKPGSSPFSGATGGTVSRAAASAARVGVGTAVGAGGAGGGLFAGLSAQLGALWATAAGKLILGVIAAVMAAAALAVVAMIAGGGGAAREGKGPDLGGISSGIKIDKGGASGLKFAAGAGRGQLNFGGPAGAAQKAETAKAPEAPKTEKSEAAPETEALPEGGVAAGEVGKSGDSGRANFGTKIGALSSSTGGTFGGKDVFQGGPKFGSTVGGLSKFQGQGLGGGGGRGKLARSGMRPGSRSLGVRNRRSRAMAQLRGMGPMSSAMRASGVGMDAAAAKATEQFEGSKPTEAAPPGPEAGADTSPSGNPGGGSGTGASSGPSAPDVTTDIPEEVTCGENEVPDYSKSPPGCKALERMDIVDATPWTGLLEAAQAMIVAASVMITLISILYCVAECITCSSGGGLMGALAGLCLALGGLMGGIAMVLAGIAGGQGAAWHQVLILEICGALTIATAAWSYAVPGGGSMLGPIIMGGCVAAGSALNLILTKTGDWPDGEHSCMDPNTGQEFKQDGECTEEGADSAGDNEGARAEPGDPGVRYAALRPFLAPADWKRFTSSS